MEVASPTYRLPDHIRLEVLIDSVDRWGCVDGNALPWRPQLPTPWNVMTRLESAHTQIHVSYAFARYRVPTLHSPRQSITDHLPQATLRDQTGLLGNILFILEHGQRRYASNVLVRCKFSFLVDLYTNDHHSSRLERRCRSIRRHL
jgi:hypothetical protein